MRMVLFPPVEPERLAAIRSAAGTMEVVNASTEQEAAQAIVEAEAFFGKITPRLLAHARHLRWVQAPTASLEHYMFPELIEHPCTLTNMRGLYGDVIADHVLGYVLCFARNLHLYLRQQQERRWAPLGGEESRSTFESGPCRVTAMDRAHLHLSDCTLGVVGVGHIGAEVARRAKCFGMRTLGLDPRRPTAPEGLDELRRPQHWPWLLAESDFVVIAAPHTPETQGWFDRQKLQRMKPTAYLINVGRGAIVPEHPLWEMPNVIITPHVAAASPHIARRHLQLLLENVQRFVSGRELLNVVDKARWF